MLKQAGNALDGLNPRRVVVTIGATAQGIGAVYALAKRLGKGLPPPTDFRGAAHAVLLPKP